MKRSIIITLIALTLVVSVGCTRTNDKKGESQGDSTKIEEQSKANTFMGKVSDIVGNQISMKLTDDEFISSKGSGGEVSNVETNLNTVNSDTVDDSNLPNLSEELVNEELSDEGDIPGEMNFDGETKEITIPAGIEILNNVTNKKAKMSDIKKGSVITVTMDEKTNTIISIKIME